MGPGPISLCALMVTFVEGEEYMKITVTSVKFNTGLEDSFFKMNQ